MQALRRGGLKNGSKVNPKDVDGRVAQLGAQSKAESDEKVAEGKAKAKAKNKGKAGWTVPEDASGRGASWRFILSKGKQNWRVLVRQTFLVNCPCNMS